MTQDPNHFVLGAEELKNVEIYSILQTKLRELYVSTNQGLYLYKRGKMQSLPNAPNQKGSSLFRLIENDNGEVFCLNLNGQIFKIVNNRIIFFFQIPEKYLDVQINMAFGPKDTLVICSKGCFSLIENVVKEIIHQKNTHQKFILNQLSNKEIFIGTSNKDSVIHIDSFGLKHLPYPSKEHEQTWSNTLFYLRDRYFTKKQLDEINIIEDPHDEQRRLFNYFQFDKNEIWRTSDKGAVELIQIGEKNLYSSNRYFRNTFISTVHVTNDGIVYLGTFGRGVFVIPNINIKNYSTIVPLPNAHSVAVDKEDNVFISDRLSGTYHFKTRLSRIKSPKYSTYGKVFIVDSMKMFINNEFPHLFQHSSLNNGALKNIERVNDNTLLFATSFGIEKQGPQLILDEDLWKGNKSEFRKTNKVCSLFDKRCYDVKYDRFNNILYAATLNSLEYVDKKLKLQELFLKNQSIIANDLHFMNGMLWCATQTQGILVFKNNELHSQYNVSNGLGNNFVLKFEEKDGRLFVLHESGFQIFDLDSEEFQTIGRAEGIENGSINDFSIGKENIWFLVNSELISYPAEEIVFKPTNITLSIDSILVNDTKLPLTSLTKLGHSENNINIYPNFNGLLFESESKLEYNLVGTSSISKAIPVSQNSIDFAFLPPGEYEFSISATYRNIYSKPITLKFNIAKAFWKTWWFYTIITISAILILSFILYRKNKIQAIKLTEQLEKGNMQTEVITSQLKALRSQMNPHFIFNSLNSIQDLILEKETEASYDYIVLFSKMVRNALKYSDQEYITIENEILFLESYLELEKLRFGSDLNYTINYKGPEAIKLPSLIIQPFVENALIHGLFHKKGFKNLIITFTFNKACIKCTIEDNGIGQINSNLIRKRQGGSHESYALRAISKRLRILQKRYGNNLGYQVKDKQSLGLGDGTIVEVILPLISGHKMDNTLDAPLNI